MAFIEIKINKIKYDGCVTLVMQVDILIIFFLPKIEFYGLHGDIWSAGW